jgi:hypothetical protein
MNTTQATSSRDSLQQNTKDLQLFEPWMFLAPSLNFNVTNDQKVEHVVVAQNFDYSCNLSIMPPTYPSLIF